MRLVVYDLSRLALRITRPVPSGIDRVDLAWAKAALAHDACAGVVITGVLGQRFAGPDVGRAIVRSVEDAWSEQVAPEDDPAFLKVRARLSGQMAAEEAAPRSRMVADIRSVARLFARGGLGPNGLFPAKNPRRAVPNGAVYLNISQFPLALPRLSGWLEARRDLRAGIMVHDMLPLTHPEFFPPGEFSQHQRFIETSMRLASHVLVPSLETESQLRRYLEASGLPIPEVIVCPLRVDPAFAAPPVFDKQLSRVPFFVFCGTIEPRKNLLFLLNVWRELIGRLGQRAPHLVIVGARGWENENIVDLLERSDALRPFVHEISGLGTPGLKRLLDHCCALLMPSFEEGFGLPVLEAAVAGTPIITTQVPALREVHGVNASNESSSIIDPVILDPIDGEGWLAAIRAKLIDPPRYLSSDAAFPKTRRSASADDLCSSGYIFDVISAMAEF